MTLLTYLDMFVYSWPRWTLRRDGTLVWHSPLSFYYALLVVCNGMLLCHTFLRMRVVIEFRYSCQVTPVILVPLLLLILHDTQWLYLRERLLEICLNQKYLNNILVLISIILGVHVVQNSASCQVYAVNMMYLGWSICMWPIPSWWRWNRFKLSLMSADGCYCDVL